jgi:hypothetical protein
MITKEEKDCDYKYIVHSRAFDIGREQQAIYYKISLNFS